MRAAIVPVLHTCNTHEPHLLVMHLHGMLPTLYGIIQQVGRTLAHGCPGRHLLVPFMHRNVG